MVVTLSLCFCVELQSNEQQSRSLDVEAEAPAASDTGVAEASTGSRSLSKSALSAASALAGGMFGLDDQLPKFEAAARELVHPLFEKLKTEVSSSTSSCARNTEHPSFGE